MNAGMVNSMESLFGPPSEPIAIDEFIRMAKDIDNREPAASTSSQNNCLPDWGWNELSEEKRQFVAMECSVADIRDSLFQTWNNPKLSAYVLKDHEYTVASLYATTKSAKPKRKAHFPDPDQLTSDVSALQRNLDAIKLSSWKLQADSVLFMRTPKNSDQNVLAHVKMAKDDTPFSNDHQAVITVTVYNRVAWGPSYVSRASQHAFLSSQTLGDLFEAIPCTSNEFPEEALEGGCPIGYTQNERSNGSGGCVVCIDGTAYGDGATEADYADKLLLHLGKVPKNTITKSPTSMHDTPLSSLSVRINEPYWLLHQGNCEHFIVFDQIRLYHPSDPPSGFPLTLQITPPLLDLCRACARVPAVWSVIGDVRLGETPCVMCGPCWRSMGDSKGDGVITVPLPRYDLGW